MSNYTQLGFVKQTDGENTGTWGDVLNENLIDLLDDSIGGYVEVNVASGNVTLAFADGTADNNGRHAVIKFTGSPGTTRTVTFPDKQINYFIVNGSDSSVICTSGSGAATVTIPTGLKDIIYVDGSDEIYSMLGSPHLTSSGNFTVDATTDIILDADGGDIFFKDAGTTFGSATNTSGNLIIKSGTTTALTFSGANVTVAGDLTVSGDDITMGTNTSGHILVADGTNFNPVAVGDLSAISSIASDDVFLAVDTSGGGLKKVARSVVVSGLATSSALNNVVEDTSPQLGGNLDTNSANILIDDAHFIGDESGNEQIIFQTTGSAVNQFDVTNAASGSGPLLSATGSDSNIDLNILAKGTGHVTIKGDTNSGAIQFNCESNSHGQIVIAQPHSAAVTNTLTLPAGSSSTLVSLVSTDTLTNKTLTSPKINEDVAVTSTATELNVLDGITAVVGELNALDIGATAIGTAVASKAVILDANKDYTGFRNITLSGELDAGSLDVSGDADIDGTLEADAITVAGVALATFVRDTVGTNMLSSNTESGIAVTYDTTNDNIDFAISAAQTGITSLLATDIKIGEDDQTKIDFETADEIHFFAANVEQVYLGDNIFGPQSDSDVDLGSTGVRWKDAFVDTITVTGEIDGASLDISGNADIDGTLETDALSIASTTVSATAAELNYSDLATLGTTAASKVFTADANNLTKITGGVFLEEDTLSFDATQDWDVRASPVAQVTLTANVTFDAPSNPTTGQYISIVCIQDGTGSRTISWNAVFEFTGGTAPTATTTAAKADLFTFRYHNSHWIEVGRNLNLTRA